MKFSGEFSGMVKKYFFCGGLTFYQDELTFFHKCTEIFSEGVEI